METIFLIALCILIAACFAAPLITLSILAWNDWKTSTVLNWQLILYTVSLIPLAIFSWVGTTDIFLALVIVAVVVAGTIILMRTNKLATGDALMIIPSAVAYGSSSILLILGALFFTAIFFLGRKREKKTPFAPGLLVASAALSLPSIIIILGTIPAII